MTNQQIADAITDMTFAQRAIYNGMVGGTNGRFIISTDDTEGDGYTGNIGDLKEDIDSKGAGDIDSINNLLSDVFIKHPCD